MGWQVAAAESVNSLYKKELIERDGPSNGGPVAAAGPAPAWPATSRPPAPAEHLAPARALPCPQPGRDTHRDHRGVTRAEHRDTVSTMPPP